MRLTVSDVVSPSYFVATAAVELGYFAEEGVPVEFVPTPPDASTALREGEIDFIGGSAYTALRAFPEWRGGKLLCTMSQYTYWFLAIRVDIPTEKGDVQALKGLRISASRRGPGLALRKLLEDAGLDLDLDGISIVDTPHDPSGNWAWDGVRALRDGLADAYWGNAMRADIGVREGVAKIHLDVRRGDGPDIARSYTFTTLVTTERLVHERPEIARGAVRAIVRAQRDLKADPSLAVAAAQRLFPELELGLIAGQVARDAPFYEPAITPEMVAGATAFARRSGLLQGEVSYEQAVATELAPLWGG